MRGCGCPARLKPLVARLHFELPAEGQAYPLGPGTLISRRLDRTLPSLAQTAPVASQSVVRGSTTVTAASPSGATLISHLTFFLSLLPGSSRRAPTTSPPVTVKA